MDEIVGAMEIVFATKLSNIRTIEVEIGTTNIMTTSEGSHYDDEYFNWQRATGEFSARVNSPRFQRFIQATDRVVDFGCGGAYLLAALTAGEKLGVEINPAAVRMANQNGVRCVKSVEEITEGWADVIISNSALEHVPNPLQILQALRTRVRVGGRVVFSVPHEHTSWHFKADDINHHLYTWSPMSAGHLFMEAGFDVQDVETTLRIGPPMARQLHALFGNSGYGAICYVYRFFRLGITFLRRIGVDADVLVIATRRSD